MGEFSLHDGDSRSMPSYSLMRRPPQTLSKTSSKFSFCHRCGHLKGGEKSASLGVSGIRTSNLEGFLARSVSRLIDSRRSDNPPIVSNHATS